MNQGIPDKSKKKYQWDANEYARHSSVQFEWALDLIEKLALRGDESLLDIGCGDGKVTAAIAARLPEGRAIGIDSSADMVALAEKKHPRTHHPNLIFSRADVREMDFHEHFDVAFSNAALHWVRNHRPVLHRVKRALKRGGRLLFQMGGAGNARDIVTVLDDLIEKDRWKEFFSEFSFPYGFHGVDEYREWLKQAGFDVIRVELLPKDMKHDGQAGLAGWIRTTWLPYLERIPPGEREVFISEIVDAYTAEFPLDNEGRTHVYMARLEVEAVKPFSP